jgi:hypothetical protein
MIYNAPVSIAIPSSPAPRALSESGAAVSAEGALIEVDNALVHKRYANKSIRACYSPALVAIVVVEIHSGK